MSKILELPVESALELPADSMSKEQKDTLGSVPPSLEALFDRDPLSLTRPELNLIIAELRAQRSRFVTAEIEAKTQGRRVNAKKAVKGEPQSASLNALLEDL